MRLTGRRGGGILMAAMLVMGNDNPLVDVRAVIPDVVLDIRYATPDNFLKQAVYPFPAAYLRKTTASRLARAADVLRSQGFRLKIFDGYRPLSAQKKMWEILPDRRYVADPKKGSYHNRGGAVDLTLARMDGGAVEMPSDYDDFSPKARHGNPSASPAAKKNLKTLRDAMEAAGFKALEEEWWHYHDPGARSYPILDAGFEMKPS